MIASVIFMIISIYRPYYYYCSDMDGASDVHCLWTYGVWVLIPNRFGHSESIDANNFQFHALANEIWVILVFAAVWPSGNQNKMLFS